MQAKKNKLEQQSISNSLESSIFKGIAVFVNGYTSKFLCSVLLLCPFDYAENWLLLTFMLSSVIYLFMHNSATLDNK